MSDVEAAADPVPQIESGGAPKGVEGSGSVTAEMAAATGGADDAVRVVEQMNAQATEESLQVTADPEGYTAVGSDRVEQPLQEDVGGDRASQALQEAPIIRSASRSRITTEEPASDKITLLTALLTARGEEIIDCLERKIAAKATEPASDELILITTLRAQLTARGEQIIGLMQKSKEYLERKIAAKATMGDLRNELLNCSKELKQVMLTNIDLTKMNQLLKSEVELLCKELKMTKKGEFVELPGPSDA